MEATFSGNILFKIFVIFLIFADLDTPSVLCNSNSFEKVTFHSDIPHAYPLKYRVYLLADEEWENLTSEMTKVVKYSGLAQSSPNKEINSKFPYCMSQFPKGGGTHGFAYYAC